MTEWSCDDFYCHMFDVRNSSAVWHMNCDVRTSSWILLLAPPPPCWPVVTSGSHLSPHLSSVLGCRWAFCLSANCFSCILIKNAVWSQFKVCVDLLWRHCDSVHSIRTSRCKRPSESREARTEQHVWKLQRDKPTSSRMFSTRLIHLRRLNAASRSLSEDGFWGFWHRSRAHSRTMNNPAWMSRAVQVHQETLWSC